MNTYHDRYSHFGVLTGSIAGILLTAILSLVGC